MAALLYGDWGKVLARLATLNALMEKNLQRATKRNAIFMRDKIKETIRVGREEWPELKEATIKRKGSSRILVDQADLMNCITALEAGKFIYFIGVPRAVRHSNGEELVNIGAIHEFGSSDGKTPRRSFIQSTFNEQKDKLPGNWKKAAQDTLNGKVYSG